MHEPLTIGSLELESPIVLAPMAGITNIPFRLLCREFGGGLYISEMVTSRALVERNPTSLRLLGHDSSEQIRSVQLYGVDPNTIAQSVTFLVEHNLADHIDLNFGCPVPKITRKGGGAALPWKLELFQAIVKATVQAARHIPVTVKMRKGIDSDHLTYLEAGSIAEQSGAAAITLHARTAADFYSGNADWSAITTLKQAITTIPVLGNGDIWSAEDALSMIEETGCDGVVVGRGCLGRPWIFGDLNRAFQAREEKITYEQARQGYAKPSLGKVADTFFRHATLLADFFESELRGSRDIRKHAAWYFKGYPVGGTMRSRLSQVETLDQLRSILDELDADIPFPGDSTRGARGRAGSPKRPVLPHDWLESRTIDYDQKQHVFEAEEAYDGG